jgi:predicted membrane channel-forming protein YqfA (hemolysin III family)
MAASRRIAIRVAFEGEERMNAPMVPMTRPRLRGVFHLYAFVGSLGLGGVLFTESADGRTRLAAAIYAAAVAVMFGASAFHHRITSTPRSDDGRAASTTPAST